MQSNSIYSYRDPDSLLAVLQERQERILSRLPKYAKITFAVSILGLAIAFVTEVLNNGPAAGAINRLISEPNLVGFIAFLLGLVSSLVIWMFVLYSLTFVLFIAYYAHKSSQETKTTIMVRQFRWVQLYASTFLPMVVFATAWSSFSAEARQIPVILTIETWNELAAMLGGAVALATILSLVNFAIPIRLVAFRLSIFSILLYSALFLAYGQGFGLASHIMVFGILLYLIFRSDEINDLGRRIAIYDVDPSIAERFDVFARRRDESRSAEDEIKLKKQEEEVAKAMHELDLRSFQTEHEMAYSEQLFVVKKKGIELNRQINKVHLNILNQKIQTLNKVFTILSEELTEKSDKEIPERLEELRNNVKNYTPMKIQEEMKAIITESYASLEGIPESLNDIRKQLILATDEIDQQVKRLAASPRGESASDEE